MAHFDGSESFDVKVGIKGTQAAQELKIPILFQSRMQTADHVNFGDTDTQCVRDRANDLVNGAFESMSVAFLGGESTKLAGKDADVGVVDITIKDVSGVIAVLSLSDGICDDAEGIEIVRAI